MAKFVTVFCVVLLAYGAQCSILSDLIADVDSIIDTAVKSAVALKASVNKSLSSLIAAAEKASVNISSSISDNVSEYQKAVASVVNSTTSDIHECTDKFSKAIEDIQSNATDCITNVLAEADSVTADFATKFAGLIGLTEEVRQNATACGKIWGTNPNPITLIQAGKCLSTLTVTVKPKIAAQLAELTDSATSTVNSIVELQAKLEVCESSAAVNSAGPNAKTAYESFKKCVSLVTS